MTTRTFARIDPRTDSRTEPDTDCTFLDEASAAIAAAAPTERVIMGLLYMLVQLSTRGACRHMVLAIGAHFEILARHDGASPELRTTALQLRDHWMRCIANANDSADADPGPQRGPMH